MIPIAVCDDERIHGLRTREVILSHGGVRDPVVQLFETPDALLDAIRLRDYCPRVAVLDIRMEGTDGILLAEQINDLLPQCAVIFLTAFLEYATDVYETRHVYFILKSELEQRIGSALERLLTERGCPRTCSCLPVLQSKAFCFGMFSIWSGSCTRQGFGRVMAQKW